MSLVKPKKKVYQFSVNENVEISGSFSIPGKIGGVDTSIAVQVEQVGKIKSEDIPAPADTPAEPQEKSKKKKGRR